MRRSYTMKGFSLIELVIVLSAVAILASFALPSMSESMSAGRRADAINSLLQLQMLQERWRVNHSAYSATLGGTACNTLTATGLCWPGTVSVDGFYSVSLSNVSASTYTLQASPKSGTAQVNDRCGNFVLTEAGPNYSAAGSASAGCWKKG